LSGSGTYTLATNTILGGNLTLASATGTLGLGSYNVTINSTNTYSNAGTLRLNGNETINFSINPNVGTVEYVGTSTYSSLPAGNSYNNLIFSGAGVWRQNAAVTVNGNVTIATSSILQSQGYGVTLGGNWTNSGTYSGGGNTTTFNGVNQIILGTTTFSNLVKNVTITADTLYFGAGQTQTVTGTFALSGESGALLSLRSTVTDTPWILVAPSTLDIEYLDVKDSNNTGVTIAAAGLNITNSGNNTGWNFSSGVSNSGGGGYSPPLQSYTPPVVVLPATVSASPTPIAPVVLIDVPPVVDIPEPKAIVPTLINTKMGAGAQVVVFTRLLRLYTVHVEVKLLQKYLNSHGFVIATRGPGSLGKETTYFGAATRNALIRFQKAHKLKQTGLTDEATRKLLNKPEELVESTVDQLDSALLEEVPAAVLAEKIFVTGFNRDLKLGDVHVDVKRLQQFLNATGFMVATRGVGSPGKESNVYGVATKAAVKRFQEANRSIILTPQSLKKGNGVFGPATRKVLNSFIK
jgi:peptidoglycan hydrolase-like protein with peptidoglycan-binding domain